MELDDLEGKYTATFTTPTEPGTYLVKATVDEDGLRVGDPVRFDLASSRNR
jgi:hypothetical protein